jgi:hypothetical protein
MHFPDKLDVILKSDMSKSEGGNAPLGFAFPSGSDAPAKKRRQTAVAWAEGRRHYGSGAKDKWSEISITNIPTSGFKIVKAKKRSRDWFGSGATVFRIEDPRGFEFDIYGANMFEIMLNGQIDHGIIQGECIFARDGAKNALMLVDSDEYRATKKASELQTAAAKFSLRDASPGDWVMTAEGTEATYLGKIFIEVTERKRVKNTSNDRWYARYRWEDVKNVKERYVMIYRDSSQPYRLVAKPQITHVIKKNDLDATRTERMLEYTMSIKDIAKCFSHSAIIHRWSRKKIKD